MHLVYKGRLIWTAILCVGLPSICTTSDAAVGTITEQIANPPSIQRSKTMLTGAKGTGVEMQDEVKTTKGKVGITFQDNTQVQVNENSRLVIDDFVYDPKSTKGGKLAVNVASGTVRYASGQIAKNNPQAVAVNTPTATIGVRGTDFTATVDELGASTIILLPSCPYGWIDVARDCKTGEISVTNDAGSVILNRPFQATKVETRGSFPTKPVIVNLVPDAINNMLIVAPPKELKEDKTTTRAQAKGALDVDFLKETGLVNAFDAQQKEVYQNKLDRNFLNQDFLANILDIVNAQLAAQLNLLNTQKSGLLPDYVATTGVTVEVDDLQVTLCRNDGSNQQCVTTPKNQNSTIYQQQGSVEIKNRVNSGGGTTITLRQN
jgi:FecR protein